MKIKVNLAKNTFYSALSNFSNIFLLVLLILAARILGVEEYGKFTFAMALVAIFSLLADFGVTELSKRSVARKPSLARKYLGNILVWKLILSIIVLLGIVFTINFLSDETDVRLLVYLLGIAAVAKTFKTTALAFCQAFERFDVHAILHISHNAILFLCSAIALNIGIDVIGLGIIFVVIKLSDLILTYWIIDKKIVEIRLEFNSRFLKVLQVTAVPFAMYAIVQEMYWYVDTVMLSIMENHEEVGLYNAAYRLFDGLVIIPMILSQAISPQMYRLFPTDRRQYMVLVRRAIKFVMIVSIIVISFGIFFSHDAILLFFGTEFDDATLALQILLSGFLFVFLNIIIMTILISINEQKLLLLLGATGLFSNVALNLILIPRYGFIGASLATVCSELLVLVAGYYLLTTKAVRFPLIAPALRPLLALFIIGGIGVTLGIELQPIHLFPIIPLYMMLLLALRTFDDEELGAIRRIAGFWRE